MDPQIQQILLQFAQSKGMDEQQAMQFMQEFAQAEPQQQQAFLAQITGQGEPQQPAEQEQAMQQGGWSIEGYKRNSPDRDNPVNYIPGNNITMKDVDQDLMLYGDGGEIIHAKPGGEYHLPNSSYVMEIPMAQQGKKLTAAQWKAIEQKQDMGRARTRIGSEAAQQVLGTWPSYGALDDIPYFYPLPGKVLSHTYPQVQMQYFKDEQGPPAPQQVFAGPSVQPKGYGLVDSGKQPGVHAIIPGNGLPIRQSVPATTVVAPEPEFVEGLQGGRIPSKGGTAPKKKSKLSLKDKVKAKKEADAQARIQGGSFLPSGEIESDIPMIAPGVPAQPMSAERIQQAFGPVASAAPNPFVEPTAGNPVPTSTLPGKGGVGKTLNDNPFKLNPWQLAPDMLNLLDSMKRAPSYLQQMDENAIQLERMNPTQARAQLMNAYRGASAAIQDPGTQVGRGVQVQQYTNFLNALNTLNSGYDEKNVQIANQEEMANNQMERQTAQANIGLNDQFYVRDLQTTEAQRQQRSAAVNSAFGKIFQAERDGNNYKAFTSAYAPNMGLDENGYITNDPNKIVTFMRDGVTAPPAGVQTQTENQYNADGTLKGSKTKTTQPVPAGRNTSRIPGITRQQGGTSKYKLKK